MAPIIAADAGGAGEPGILACPVGAEEAAMRPWSVSLAGGVRVPPAAGAWMRRHRLALVLASMWLRAILVAARMASGLGVAAVAELSAAGTLGGAVVALGACALFQRFRLRSRSRRASR